MRVLAVGANPDDVELLCAGTLAKYTERGDTVAIAYLTQGDKGSRTLLPEKIADIRRFEAEEAARLINSDLFSLGIPDGEVVPTLAFRRRVVEIIRRTTPDIIITHHSDDYMSDHINTSKLVKEASFWAGSAQFAGDPGEAPSVIKRPQIFYMDTVCGIGFCPQSYVDITSVMDMKIEMLSKHKSQINYMKERDGLDFLEAMITAARYRGHQCGVKYAEGFIPERVYPSLSPMRLLP